MRRQSDRYSIDLPVELLFEGQRRWVSLQDLSRSGMFLQTREPLQAGTRVQIAIAPEGRRLLTTGQVAHTLEPGEARELGRHPGMGIQFLTPNSPTDHLFGIAVERLLRERRAATPSNGLHVIVGDGDTRMLERMSSALGAAGFSVTLATTGMEVLAACVQRVPDVVVIERMLPVLDGFRVLEAMAHDPRLAAIPVIIASEVAADVGPAFERGAMDFVARPYPVAEVIVRARRLALASPMHTDRVVMRGSILELGVPALLTMLDLEHKSGRLVVTGDHVGWIDLEGGKIVNAGTSSGDLGLDAVMAVLDADSGSFELTSVARPREGDLVLPVPHVLMEHARRVDETNRDTTGPIFARPPTPQIHDQLAS